MSENDTLGKIIGKLDDVKGTLKERVNKLRMKLTSLFDEGFNPDEVITFYPSIGIRPKTGDWRMEIRGRLYERVRLPIPSSEALPIAIALAGVSNADALLDKVGDETGLAIFKERLADFVLNGQGNEIPNVQIGTGLIQSAQSNDDGFFGLGSSRFPLSVGSLSLETDDDPWIPYKSTNEGNLSFSGRSLMPERHGVIVVSDIDDTIKDSNVPDKPELVLNTLFRPFKSTPGMAEIYREWHKSRARFIYLSNSPYQLFRPLAKFLQGPAGYPDGAYYMRLMTKAEIKQEITNLVAPSTTESRKKHNLIPILEAFPDNSFVLVGDSTESDAEIYADLYHGTNFPEEFSKIQKPYKDRIKRIYIREVTNSRERESAVAALARLPEGTGTFFDESIPAKVLVAQTRAVFQEAALRRGASA